MCLPITLGVTSSCMSPRIFGYGSADNPWHSTLKTSFSRDFICTMCKHWVSVTGHYTVYGSDSAWQLWYQMASALQAIGDDSIQSCGCVVIWLGNWSGYPKRCIRWASLWIAMSLSNHVYYLHYVNLILSTWVVSEEDFVVSRLEAQRGL